MTSYPNFYLANGAVIVPIAEHPLDEEALSIIAGAFPEREVVGVPSRIVAFGGGGTHCITQQLPVAGALAVTAFERCFRIDDPLPSPAAMDEPTLRNGARRRGAMRLGLRSRGACRRSGGGCRDRR